MSGLIKHWKMIRTWLIHNFKPWQILGISVVIFLYSGSMSSNISRYILELFFATLISIVNLGNIVLIVWDLPVEAIESLKEKLDKIHHKGNLGDNVSIQRREMKSKEKIKTSCNFQSSA